MSSTSFILLLLSLLQSSLLVHAQRTGGNLSNCKSGCQLGELCIGNPFSQIVEDSECYKCAGGREYWPCNFETLCYCNDADEDAPRIPPAPKSGVKVNENIDPCIHILTQDVFDRIVQPTTEEAKALYTYDGLCNAIALYNSNHNEKFAMMGNEEQIRAELAAFLAHTAVDTFGYSITREEIHCVDPISGSDGKTYCQVCTEGDYNTQTKTCTQNYFENTLDPKRSYQEYCELGRQPPQGCQCSKETITPLNDGYIPASNAYFTRGTIQVSWNYDYYGASQALTGSGDLLCDNPDLVSTNPQLAWGVGIYKWMEKMKDGTTGSTAHKQILKGNFGGSVKVS